jgi:methionyl-tRNA formyltransferase
MQKLRIIFMGTPEFAAHNLKVLYNSDVANIVAVITAPDKPAGRGQKLKPSAVKEAAMELGIPVMQPEKLKDLAFLSELQSYNADLQVVVAFRMLPEVVWNMPAKGSFNLHASLLPQYRGAAPINWAVMNGEKQTGVTTFFLNHDIDTGNIIMQESLAILPEDDAGTVHDKLMEAGSKLVVKTVSVIADNTVEEKPQSQLSNGEEIKPAPKIFKDDCRTNWTDKAVRIHNKIRGLSPYPTAWTELVEPGKDPILMKIFKAEILYEESRLKPCEVYCDKEKVLMVGTSDFALRIFEIQLAGKKRMYVEDFLRGYRWQEGSRVV